MAFLFRIILALVLVGTISSCSCTYYVVRHADRFPNGQLTPEGVIRASDLWEELSDKKIDEIYTTDIQRTKDTAQPTVDSTGLTPIEIDAHDTPQLVSRLRGTSKKSILVVGHSDTVPVIVDSLMYAAQGIVIGGDDYDNLYIIKVKRSNGGITRTLTQSTYGVASPAQ